MFNPYDDLEKIVGNKKLFLQLIVEDSEKANIYDVGKIMPRVFFFKFHWIFFSIIQIIEWAKPPEKNKAGDSRVCKVINLFLGNLKKKNKSFSEKI